ncbi:MAG: amidohydrolase family protein [Clostridiales Family XIII bacterium]|nr:amidohydrolase family protein [Clostridia bacterium]MDE8735014.1 amidohydrolase family protein [Eubacteriales bacterium DFI.9.88]MDY3010713.1 amidohydrolase family protein [Clostridiales Family XIII bacterium]
MNLVLKSTCIYDSVSDAPFAGYIEMEGGKIRKVTKGDTDCYDDRTIYDVRDCGDRTITAGLIDSHVHLFLGSLHNATVDIYDTKTEEEAAEKLYEFYKDRDDEWIIGFRWCQFRWPEEKLPTKASLDRYFPDRPVIAFNDELHGVWVNSRTLELCGIDRNTPDPAGGTIARDENGEPTGFLLEQPAMELVTKEALCVSPEKEEELIEGFIKKAHTKGVTSVGAVHVLRIMKHEACRRLENKGKLKMRVFFAPHMEMDMGEALRLKEEYTSDRLKFLGLKGFMDGTPLGYTGYMVEPYSDRPGFRSEPLVDRDWLYERSKECYKNDIAMRLHACGDGAVRMALDAYEAARKEYGPKDVRNAIEHIEVLHRDDVARFAETNTVASIQPSHMLMETLEDHAIFPIVGKERAKLAWPGKTLAKNGAVVAFGTDYPIVDLDPVDSIYRAVKRRMEDDLPEGGWNPQEKFTMAEAIKNSTIGPAYMMRMEDKLGTLEEGKIADINVFSKNIFKHEEDIPSVNTDMTVFEGEIVYDKL